MRLYFLRHGKAIDPSDPSYSTDAERTLTSMGRCDTKLAGEALARLEITFDRIWTSPLVRARDTAKIIARELTRTRQLAETNLLEPGATLSNIARLAEMSHGAEDVLFVGHEPDFSRLVGSLIAGSGASIDFKKGAIAAVRVEPPLQAGCGTLLWLVPPRWMG